MNKYTLYIYDVWGNSKDGFEVNDVFRTDSVIEVDENTSDRAINRRLGLQGITWSGAEWCGDMSQIWGYSKKHGNPVCELRSND